MTFQWGVAGAAYQIEGAHDADGKARSIWDDFCKVPGAIDDGTTAEVACDFYHRRLKDEEGLQFGVLGGWGLLAIV